MDEVLWECGSVAARRRKVPTERKGLYTAIDAESGWPTLHCKAVAVGRGETLWHVDDGMRAAQRSKHRLGCTGGALLAYVMFIVIPGVLRDGPIAPGDRGTAVYGIAFSVLAVGAIGYVIGSALDKNAK